MALLVGGTGSIGRVVAAGFVAEGATVVVADLPAKLEGFHAATVVPIDVADEPSVCEAVAEVIRRHRRIDILVVLAGVFQARPIAELAAADWDRVMEINLRGTFLVCREVVPQMQRSDYGRVICFASLAGQVGGLVAGADYAASKAGVLSLVKSLARQTPQPWITINAISPGPVEGEMTAAWPEEDRRAMTSRIPLGRFARPGEIADVVLFLSSPRAAYIHGARIDVNGGIYMD